MNTRFLILLICLPLYAFAECNHVVVDRNPALACVNVANYSNIDVVVTGFPGFSLKPNLSEETMLLSGSGNLVHVSPNPLHYDDKRLNCRFKTKDAKKNKITIRYYKDFYEVTPAQFINNCEYIR